MVTCEDGIPISKGREEREGGVFLRSQAVGQSGEHRDRAPPGVPLFHFCPKWRLAVGVGANGGKCQRERGGRWPVLTSAVVVRVDDAAAA